MFINQFVYQMGCWNILPAELECQAVFTPFTTVQTCKIIISYTDVISDHLTFIPPVQLTKKIYNKSKALLRLRKLCHFKMIGTSCIDEVWVKVPSFQKSHISLWYKIFLRYVIHLHFNSYEGVNDSCDLTWKQIKSFAINGLCSHCLCSYFKLLSL